MADPRLADADALLRARNPAAAIPLLEAVLSSGGLTAAKRRAALLLRSRAHEDLRNLPAAIADLRGALAVESRDVRVQNTLGILLADAGDLLAAVAAFEQATRLDPRYARAWNNLGNALRNLGRGTEAEAAVRRALTAQPDYAQAWCNLGIIQRDLGHNDDAEVSLRRALELKPDQHAALIALASSARADSRLDEAAELYARAARLPPKDGLALLQLAGTLAERDDLDLAGRAYDEARSANPRLLRAALGAALTLPMVYADAAAVAAVRDRYARGLRNLAEEVEEIVRGRRFDEVINDLRWSNFLLAYQGEDDRELQQAYAGIVARAIDGVAPGERAPLPGQPVAGRRLRVGFASSFFSAGTVGMYFRSWIEHLDRDRFEVFVYHLRRGTNALSTELEAQAAHFRRFDGPALLPARVAPVIRADELDVLVYPELGMDGTTFALAALRLAPVQCAAWGHPVTSGHATIDVWFSCAAMEPADAQRHYAERLQMLPGIGTRYAKPELQPAAARAVFGLPEHATLFLCPQSLFKIHPDNDALFARTLAATEDSRLVIFEGRHPVLTAKYRARLDSALRRVGLAFEQRVVVLPQCSHPQYLQLNGLCDAMLDTLRWSGGNTSFDALACGLPIVTLQGRFMRGRQSAGMLTLMGIDDLIAADEDDYVRIAARLAGDAAYRADLRGRIIAAQPRIFDDPAPIRALETALFALAHGDRSAGSPPAQSR